MIFVKIVEKMTLDAERALYGVQEVLVRDCRFDGPADGESALKECQNVTVEDCFCNLRYPFWHDDGLTIRGCTLTELCRAALWYSRDVVIQDSRLQGIKALRECARVELEDCEIHSPEFGWCVRWLEMNRCTMEGEYVLMRSDHLHLTDVTLHGKYSFQYIHDALLENCVLDTKDAFWHARNVTVRNSVVRGEYLAWYSENVTFENCCIIGTQPLCYCRNLKLINCQMEQTDLAFEKSDVEATVTTPIVSVKNPRSGRISAPAVGELIRDDPASAGEVVVI